MKFLVILCSFVAATTAAINVKSANYTNYIATIPGVWQALNWLNISAYYQACIADCILFPQTWPAAGAFSNGSKAVISATYPGSKVTFFDLFSTFLGCTSVTNYTGTRIPLPITCNVTFTGYRTDLRAEPPAARTTFQYVPNTYVGKYGVPQANMKPFDFPSTFRGLRRAEFEITGSYPNNASFILVPPAGAIDNIAYRVTNISLAKR